MQQRRLGRLGHLSSVLIYGGAALAAVDEQRTRIRPSQHWLFATIEKIRRALDA